MDGAYSLASSATRIVWSSGGTGVGGGYRAAVWGQPVPLVPPVTRVLMVMGEEGCWPITLWAGDMWAAPAGCGWWPPGPPPAASF